MKPLIRLPRPKVRSFVDHTGKTFGSLTVKGYLGKRGDRHCWECQCACGVTREASSTRLVEGRARQCKVCARKALLDFHKERTSHVAFGEDKSFMEWTNDERCTVSGRTLRRRLKMGMSMEQALSKKPYWRNPNVEG